MRLKSNRNLFDCKFFTLKENINHILRDMCTRFPWKIITMAPHRKLYRHLYNTNDKVVLLSRNFVPSFCKIAGIRREDKICTINNMLSFQYDKEFHVKNKRKQILFCGRLVSQKNPYRVLYLWKRMYRQLPDWELIIVGGGPWQEKMEKLKNLFHLPNVKMLGFQNPVDFYKFASIYIMTSNYEGWPLTLMESMQFGCIPIAFESFESIRDIVDDGQNGILIPPFDIDIMADSLIRLIKEDNLTQYAESAHKKMKKFLPEEIGKQWISLFNGVLSK